MGQCDIRRSKIDWLFLLLMFCLLLIILVPFVVVVDAENPVVFGALANSLHSTKLMNWDANQDPCTGVVTSGWLLLYHFVHSQKHVHSLCNSMDRNHLYGDVYSTNVSLLNVT
jgi:hypothetical protein